MFHPDRTSGPAFPVTVGGESQPVDKPSPSRYLLRASGSKAGKVILYRPARPCVLYFLHGNPGDSIKFHCQTVAALIADISATLHSLSGNRLWFKPSRGHRR